jgi:hypothetical protein
LDLEFKNRDQKIKLFGEIFAFFREFLIAFFEKFLKSQEIAFSSPNSKSLEIIKKECFVGSKSFKSVSQKYFSKKVGSFMISF